MAVLELVLLLPLCSLLFSPISSESPELNLWPKPASVSWPGPAAVRLSSCFRILSPYPGHGHLRAAVGRYSRLLRRERHRFLRPPAINLSAFAAAPRLCSLSLSVSDLSAPLHHGADESYSLSVPVAGGDARLAAGTAWGAMRGLETFSQLAWWEPSSPPAKWVPAGIEISDRPLFPHRGLLLDTGRNFYPVRDLLRTIRAMSYNKMNVFHWHITDSQSFPLVLPSEPRLAEMGSYGEGMSYAPEDVRRVVEFGLRRGVRVVPEIDMPGHAASWAGAYPEVVTCAGEFWAPPGSPPLAAEPGAGQLNPLLPATLAVARRVLSDAAALFPDPFFHAGADEVYPACWARDPTVRDFLSRGGTHDDLLELFVNATLPFAASALNRTVLYWEDVLLGPSVKVGPGALPPASTVLQTWNNGPANTKRLAAAGYRVVVSSADFYYLDCGHGGWVSNDSRYDRQERDAPGRPFNYAGGNGGSWCAPFKAWQRVYDYDITHGLTAEEAARVLGGEVALWSEQADGAVVDGRVWPRAAAMAEALWSGNRDEEGGKRYAEAAGRLLEWRERLVGRGIRAEPIQPRWCATNPGMCNLVQ